MSNSNPASKATQPADVYFIPLSKNETTASIAMKTKAIFNKAGFSELLSEDKISAIKQHFGEKGNKGFIKPEITKAVVDKIKESGANPLLVETNTLYRGNRSNSYHHLLLAHEHGFSLENTGAPTVIMDGVNGQNQQLVKVPGEHFKEVYLASDLPFLDSVIVLSHVKGHMGAGMGAALKNLAMGFASRAGKLAQHADFKPKINSQKCTLCGLCKTYCPEGALEVTEGEMKVALEKCIGCGECYVACRSDAIEFNWTAADTKFQEKMAEHAFAAVINHKNKIGFINYFYHITKQCDCWGGENPVFCDDIGIFASVDAVAVDKACYDKGKEILGEDIFRRFWPKLDAAIQLRHAEKIGMGTQDYRLIEL